YATSPLTRHSHIATLPLPCLHSNSHTSPTSSFFFSHAPAPPEIYTLSLHDALPISTPRASRAFRATRSRGSRSRRRERDPRERVDRKSTRLNSSHLVISYAVFCLKKKKKKIKESIQKKLKHSTTILYIKKTISLQPY